jgi:hypothetical protein
MVLNITIAPLASKKFLPNRNLYARADLRAGQDFAPFTDITL